MASDTHTATLLYVYGVAAEVTVPEAEGIAGAPVRTVGDEGLVALVSELPPLEKVAVPALQSATKAIGHGQPFFSGLRPYGPDLVTGLFKGFGGEASIYYDANGHFARISAHGTPGTTNGVNSLFPSGSLPSAAGFRTGITGRCPGGAVEPASDGSNPWIVDPSICNPNDDHP